MRNALYFGDNLKVMREMQTARYHTCYLDPPYNSGRNYNIFLAGSKAQRKAFDDIWRWDAHELGHAFGLGHDRRNGNYIMSTGVTIRDSKIISATAANSELSSAAAGWLNQHHAFNEGTVDMRFEEGVYDVRLVGKSPRADGKLDLVFVGKSGGTVFSDYVPNDPLEWIFTYGIFYDNDHDTVITEIPREAFSVQIVKEPGADAQIEYRLQFAADVPSGLQDFYIYLITDKGYSGP